MPVSATKTPAAFTQLRAAHRRLGARGERLAGRLLEELGLEILARNYHGAHGEIDLVARDGGVLCFVEVKTRHRRDVSRPADAVTPIKKWHLARTAAQYLREVGHPRLVHRFDIVEIVFDHGWLTEAYYWPNEFTAAHLRETRSGAVIDLRDSATAT